MEIASIINKTLYGNAAMLFDDVDSTVPDELLKKIMKDFGINKYETLDGDHGRIETRKYYYTSEIDWLQRKENWPGLKGIGMVESTREIREEISIERRYYLSSLECDAKKFGDSKVSLGNRKFCSLGS